MMSGPSQTPSGSKDESSDSTDDKRVESSAKWLRTSADSSDQVCLNGPLGKSVRAFQISLHPSNPPRNNVFCSMREFYGFTCKRSHAGVIVRSDRSRAFEAELVTQGRLLNDPDASEFSDIPGH